MTISRHVLFSIQIFAFMGQRMILTDLNRKHLPLKEQVLRPRFEKVLKKRQILLAIEMEANSLRNIFYLMIWSAKY